MSKSFLLENNLLLMLFSSGKFFMRNMGDEFHTKEVLTPSTPGTPTSPPVILSLTLKGLIHERRIKICTPNQMLKRLPILSAQVQASNTSETLLNEVQ